jgi:hypothetical protein
MINNFTVQPYQLWAVVESRTGGRTERSCGRVIGWAGPVNALRPIVHVNGRKGEYTTVDRDDQWWLFDDGVDAELAYERWRSSPIEAEAVTVDGGHGRA